jgi:hypothetical protein
VAGAHRRPSHDRNRAYRRRHASATSSTHACSARDGPGGGEFLVRLCQRDGSSLVVFDTGKRFVEGDENENDTWQRFWTYTGAVLKQAGVTWVRIAHAGTDRNRGQRGGSSLNDDVDVVWELSRTDIGTKLRRTFSRVSWLPEEIDYVREVEPRLRFVRSGFSLPAGTLEFAALLDRLGVQVDVSVRVATKQVREQGHTARNDVIAAAVKHRKYYAAISNSDPGNAAGNTSSGELGTTTGEHRGTPRKVPGRSLGTLRGTPGNASHSDRGTRFPPVGGNALLTSAGTEQDLATSHPAGLFGPAGKEAPLPRCKRPPRPHEPRRL